MYFYILLTLPLRTFEKSVAILISLTENFSYKKAGLLIGSAVCKYIPTCKCKIIMNSIHNQKKENTNAGK